MVNNKSKEEESFLFSKKYKVTVWASKIPYASIPDDYFEETFSKNNTRARNTWSNNFKIRYFRPEDMETNGAQVGSVSIEKAIGECSFSTSYIDTLMSKARKKNLLEITWVILLFDFEYSSKVTNVKQDEILTLLGAFSYDDSSDSVCAITEN